MRKVSTAFHVIMLLLVVAAFAGAFSPAPTGNFAQDNGGYILPVIGLAAIWIVGLVVLKIARRFSN